MATLPEELLKEIEDYRYGARIPSRMEAMRRLLAKGLAQVKKKKPPASPMAVRAARKR